MALTSVIPLQYFDRLTELNELNELSQELSSILPVNYTDNDSHFNESMYTYSDDTKNTKMDKYTFNANLKLSNDIIVALYMSIFCLDIKKISELNDKYNIINKLYNFNDINGDISYKTLESLKIIENNNYYHLSNENTWDLKEHLYCYCNGSPINAAINKLGETEATIKRINNLGIVIHFLQNKGRCLLKNSNKIENIQLNHIKYAWKLLTNKHELNDNKCLLNVIDLDLCLIKLNYLEFNSFVWQDLLPNFAIFKPFTHLFKNDTKISKKKMEKLYKYIQTGNFKKFINIDHNPWKLDTNLNNWNENFRNGFILMNKNSNNISKRQFMRYFKKIFETMQNIRITTMNTFNECLEYDHNKCHTFITNSLYDKSLLQYIYEMAGLLHPLIIY